MYTLELNYPSSPQITFCENSKRIFRIKNISVSGLFLATRLNIAPGSKCIIELNRNWFNLKIKGEVVRLENSGIGVMFTQMDHKTYMMLQTKLLYCYPYPIILDPELSGKGHSLARWIWY